MMRYFDNHYSVPKVGIQLQKAQRGLSLIELMVSLALGSILMLGITKLYVDSKRSYFQDEQAARVQENARYALRLISHEIKNSDYANGAFAAASATASAVGTDCGASGVNWALDPTPPLEHANNVDDSLDTRFTCITDAETVNGSDLLVVKRTADTPTVDNGAVTAGASIDANTWYMRVADNGADVSILKGSDVNTGADVGTETGIDLWEYYASMFYLRPYSTADADGNPQDTIPTLCVRQLGRTPGSSPATFGMHLSGGCQIEGVENLQFEFGLDSDNDGQVEQFISDPSAAEMGQVRLLKIYLLMRSINTIPDHTDDKTYQLGSEAIAAKNDGFHRLVYASTVAIRNRITQ